MPFFETKPAIPGTGIRIIHPRTVHGARKTGGQGLERLGGMAVGLDSVVTMDFGCRTDRVGGTAGSIPRFLRNIRQDLPC